jgi:hypothetical protein
MILFDPVDISAKHDWLLVVVNNELMLQQDHFVIVEFHRHDQYYE